MIQYQLICQNHEFFHLVLDAWVFSPVIRVFKRIVFFCLANIQIIHCFFKITDYTKFCKSDYLSTMMHAKSTTASFFGMECHCERLEAVKLIKLTFCSETVDRCHQSQANHSFCNCFVTVFGFALTGDRRGVGRWKRELGALVI